MGFGHAILYPQRLEAALAAGPQKQRFEDAGDGFMALLGAGKTGGDISQALFERLDIGARMTDYFGPWFEAGGPFAGLQAKLDGGLGDFDAKLGDLLKYLREAPPAQWRVLLQRHSELALDVLAPIDMSALVAFLRRELEGAIDTLKRPIRNGPRNIEAHRALRTAVALRRMLRPAFAVLDDAEDDLRDLNIKAQVRLAIGSLLDKLQGPNLDRVEAMFRLLDDNLGVLLRAGAGFKVDVEVDVEVGGPHPATEDSPAARFEAQAVPHEKPGAIWTTDLVTNIFASFSLLWEVIRTAAFAQRPLDGIMMLLGLVWQIARTVIRAAWPEHINVTVPPTGKADFDFKNWLFTDQADFSMNMVWRLLGSFHEYHAASNWYLSVFRRWLGWVTHVTTWRMPYLFARSIWYARALAKESGSPEASPARLLFLSLPIGWFVGIICAIAVPWEDFQLEAMSAALVVGIILPIVFFLVALFVIPRILIGRVPNVALDRLFNIVLGVAAVLGALITALLIGELEMSSASLQSAIGALLIVVMILAGGFAIVTMFENAHTQNFFYAQAGLCGLLMVSVLFFLWYFYLDDGRDKTGVYEPLDAENSPYALPYPEGDNWLCGQSSHGIFSHVPTAWSSATQLNPNKSDNHYAFDFNHEPRVPGLAARDGFVMEFREDREDDGNQANFVRVLHNSWSSAVDPGVDQERVLTFGEYFHISQGSVRVSPGDRVAQGDQLVKIDNNGRSAQHHLHFSGNATQGLTDTNGAKQDLNIPVVFKDASTRWFRNYPLLAWIGGHGQVPGKPISMAFYVSSNPQRKVGPNPRTVRLAAETMPGTAVLHQHDLLLDAAVLGGGAIPATVTLQTSMAQGHRHSVDLTSDQIQALLEMQDVPGLVTAQTLGHGHVQEQLANRHLRNPPGATPAPVFTIAQPSGAMLTSTTRAPLALAGCRWIVRVNEAVTEFNECLVAPARLLADVAIDVALGANEILTASGVNAVIPAGFGRLGTRGAARAAAMQWRAAIIPTAQARPTALALPVLVIETRHGGQAVTLEAKAATTLPLAGTLPPLARGSGAVADGRALTRADLAALLASGLTAGQPVAAGIALDQTALAVRLGIGIAGAPATFTGGSTRLDGVLVLAYDVPSSTVPSAGTLPLAPGRFGLAGVTVPLLARQATHTVPLGGDAFAPASLAATPLEITLRGSPQAVQLRGTDTTAEAIARRINTQAEGVRAWVEGADLVVQTIEGGPDARLGLTKATTGAGTPLTLAVVGGDTPNGNGMQSASAVPLAVLAKQIELAQAAAVLSYDPAIVLPKAVVSSDRIVVSVGAGHTIAVEDLKLAGPAPAFRFEPPAATPGVSVQTEPLTAAIALAGAGWVDFVIDGTERVRIPLDTECARLELPPLTRLPAAGERLVVSTDGAAPVTIAFPGGDTSLAAVADRIAAALPQAVVRIAYRLAVQDAFWGENGGTSAALADSSGLKQAGFLRNPATFSASRIGFLRNDAPNRDGLALVPENRQTGSGWFLTAPNVARGALNPGLLTLADAGPGGAISLTVPSGWTIACDPADGGNPFGIATGVTGTSISSTAAPGASFVWGGTALRHRVRVEETAVGRSGFTWFTISALPAVLHGVRASAPLDPAPRTLSIGLRQPGGATVLHEVDFAGIRLDDLDAVAAAILEAVPGVRAWVVSDPATLTQPLGTVPVTLLHLESVGAGTGWALSAGPLELAGLLGLPVERAAAGATTLEANGTGDVADSASISRLELGANLQRAAKLITIASGPAPSPIPSTTTVAAVVNPAGYAAQETGAKLDAHLRLISATKGSVSSVECIDQSGAAIAFPAGLVRSPACRGAVVIPALPGPVALNGDLMIQFNEAPAGSAVLAPTLVLVNFPAASYSAAEVVQRINAAAVAAGAGTAILFPDGAIVIETARYGLLGAVRLPASGPKREVADALVGVGKTLFARGWPDVGNPLKNAGDSLLTGYRGRQGAALGPAQWDFGPISVAIAQDDTPDQVVDRLNQQFATIATGPIGVAAFVDGVLFVEGLTGSLSLLVNKAALGVANPDQTRPWLTPERIGEPAFDLRRTDEVRTVRVTRSKLAAFTSAQLDDWGYLRLPLNSATGQVVPFRALPTGRYGLTIRSDGAKATDYDAAAERVAAASATVVHAVRYGQAVAGGTLWREQRLPDGTSVEEWSF